MKTINKPPYTSTKQLPAFGSNVGSYVAKSQMLQQLNEKIQPLLPSAYRGVCRIANVRDKILILQLLQPAYATRLHYELGPLRDKICQLGLDIQEIQILIQPEENLPTRNPHKATAPGHKAGRALRAAIPHIDDPDLQNAVATLAKNLDKA